MSCKVSKFDFCYLVQESFKSPEFNFEVDISNDTFTLEINKKGTGNIKRYPTIKKDANTLIFDAFDFKVGVYEYKLFWDRQSKTDAVVFGEIKASDKPNECGCKEVDRKEVIVNDEVVVIEIPAVKGEKGDKGDKGEDIIIDLYVDENMYLHYSSIGEANIQFKIENGYLIIS